MIQNFIECKLLAFFKLKKKNYFFMRFKLMGWAFIHFIISALHCFDNLEFYSK